MDFDFKSQDELFKRVHPALNVKVSELKRKGYENIKDIDIWKCLTKLKWKNSKNLMLSDIVDDILNIDEQEISDFILNK